MPSPWARALTRLPARPSHADVAGPYCSALTVTFGGRCLACGFDPEPTVAPFVRRAMAGTLPVKETRP